MAARSTPAQRTCGAGMADDNAARPVEPASELDRFLHLHGLATPGEERTWTPLRGGVSSDIWRVDLPGRTICVKRALAKLRVGSDWHAPVSRNRYEWEWLRLAAGIVPWSVPTPLAHDPELGLFAMAFLSADNYPLWKEQLLAGNVDAGTAAQVGSLLATLHNATARREDIAAAFDTTANFHALRLEPYLLATAQRHPDLAPVLRALAERTAQTRIALVHGDVSPKNILIGPEAPVLLDAECAWYGDPAFDIAFCLNHLLLKAVFLPQHLNELMQAFEALAQTYFDQVHFEPRAYLEARTASLLPALTLARIDGKSPVEYLVGQSVEQELVRRLTRPLIIRPADSLLALMVAWRAGVARTEG
jgi:aminoglycoside phosphotransferase (APT) family kinase protein